MSEINLLEWSSASRCETGNVRKVNEDACLDVHHKGIWAVADGMGGHHSGDLASRAIVESLGEIQQHGDLRAFVDDVKDRLKQVNAYLLGEAAQRGKNQTIGSTVVVMVAHEDQCEFVWVGDSRLYRFREGTLNQLTRDHSRVQELVEMGVLLPEEAESHPAANIITRAVGVSESIEIDSEQSTMQAGDVYLLCSDGLYKELNEDEIASSLAHIDSKIACNHLVDLALQRACRDNVTAIVVDIQSAEHTMLRENSDAKKEQQDLTVQL